MNTIKLQQRGVLTLPKKIRESLSLKVGEVFNITNEGNRIILDRRESKDAELLRDIKQSLIDIKRGKYIEFSSIAEFKKKLKTYDAH